MSTGGDSLSDIVEVGQAGDLQPQAALSYLVIDS